MAFEIVGTLMCQKKPSCVASYEKDDLGLHTLLIPSLILILKSDILLFLALPTLVNNMTI